MKRFYWSYFLHGTRSIDSTAITVIFFFADVQVVSISTVYNIFIIKIINIIFTPERWRTNTLVCCIFYRIEYNSHATTSIWRFFFKFAGCSATTPCFMEVFGLSCFSSCQWKYLIDLRIVHTSIISICIDLVITILRPILYGNHFVTICSDSKEMHSNT